MDTQPVVFLICDKSKARKQLRERLERLGYLAEPSGSMEEFRQRPFPTEAGCLLLFLADADGDLDWLQAAGPGRLAPGAPTRSEGSGARPFADPGHWPVVAVAAEADVELAVTSMKKGAFDFILESCSDRRFAAAIDEAFRWNAVCRRQIAAVQSARWRRDQLPPTLRDVLDLLLRGHSNREIAAELSLSERTIEDRRAKIMKAMKVRTVVGLVRQALLAEGVAPRPGWGEAQAGRPSGADSRPIGEAEALAAAIFTPRDSRRSSAAGASRRSRRRAIRPAGQAPRRVRPASGCPATREGMARFVRRQDSTGQDGEHDRQPKRAR